MSCKKDKASPEIRDSMCEVNSSPGLEKKQTAMFWESLWAGVF